MAEAVVQNLKLCCRDFDATAKHACSPVAVQAVGRAVTDPHQAPRRVLLTYRAGLNASDASAVIGSAVSRYDVVSFAGTDRNEAARLDSSDEELVPLELVDAAVKTYNCEQQRTGPIYFSNCSHQQITHSRA